jgi:predicted Zn-dependent protease
MAKPSRRAAPRKSSERSVKSSTSAKSPDEQISQLTISGKREQRSTYHDAVAVYEQALRTLQEHDYAKAAELLRQVIAGFPQERELLERSRLYLGLCERHLQPSTAEPGNTQERVYAATLALNAGAPDRAIGYLKRVVSDEPSNDQALYMLAVAHAERREPALAITYLEQAIEANPENRSLARVDPDLDPLRREEGLDALLGDSSRLRHRSTETRRR